MVIIDRSDSRTDRKLKILISLFLIIILSISLFTISSEPLQESNDAPEESPVPVKLLYTMHAPIYIDGDSGFLGPNASTGISWGSGTVSDPYIIDGWDINASLATGIDIRNSDVYFLVRNCYLHGGSSSLCDGIHIFNCTNGMISNNNCSSNYVGIELSLSDDNSIVNNSCFGNTRYGLTLSCSSNNTIRNNVCELNDDGLHLSSQSNYNVIDDNEFPFNNIGIYLEYWAFYNTIQNHVITNCQYGIRLDGNSDNNVIINNTLENSEANIFAWQSRNHIIGNIISGGMRGIYLLGTGGLIDSNLIMNANIGAYLRLSSGVEVKNNTFTNNGLGVFVYESGSVNFAMNNLSGNSVGITINTADSIDITKNELFYNSGYGIEIGLGSLDIQMWNNTFIGNNGAGSTYDPSHVQAYDDGTDNWWNSASGYGNWWSDWRAPDDNWDGIVDIPYNISGSAGAKDYYPQTVPGTPIPEPSILILAGIMMMIFLIVGRTRKRR